MDYKDQRVLPPNTPMEGCGSEEPWTEFECNGTGADSKKTWITNSIEIQTKNTRKFSEKIDAIFQSLRVIEIKKMEVVLVVIFIL